MITVGIREATRGFSKLLRRVERGETVILTRYGKAIARLVPTPVRRENLARDEIVAASRALRRSVKKGGPSIRELIRAGSKW